MVAIQTTNYKMVENSVGKLCLNEQQFDDIIVSQKKQTDVLLGTERGKDEKYG